MFSAAYKETQKTKKIYGVLKESFQQIDEHRKAMNELYNTAELCLHEAEKNSIQIEGQAQLFNLLYGIGDELVTSKWIDSINSYE